MSLDELLARSDVLSVHLTHTPSTHKMFNDALFSKVCLFFPRSLLNHLSSPISADEERKRLH